MAKCGNHGQIIPRDLELLYRLHVVEGKSLSEMAKIFGVNNHNSVGNVLRNLGFQMAGRGNRAHRKLCRDCGIKPPLIVRHKLTKNGTGTRCKECLAKYKARWLIAKKATDKAFLEKCRRDLNRWYIEGPVNPKGESQWIRKAKHLLRTNRRLLCKMTNPAV